MEDSAAATTVTSSSSARSSPITFSSHLSGSTEPDSNQQPSSATGSLQSGNDSGSVLNPPPEAANEDAEFGFQRPEMRQLPLAGTVHAYDRHVFLCYKNPDVWPSHVEAAEFDRLPRLLSAALKARKAQLKKKVKDAIILFLCFTFWTHRSYTSDFFVDFSF